VVLTVADDDAGAAMVDSGRIWNRIVRVDGDIRDLILKEPGLNWNVFRYRRSHRNEGVALRLLAGRCNARQAVLRGNRVPSIETGVEWRFCEWLMLYG